MNRIYIRKTILIIIVTSSPILLTELVKVFLLTNVRKKLFENCSTLQHLLYEKSPFIFQIPNMTAEIHNQLRNKFRLNLADDVKSFGNRFFISNFSVTIVTKFWNNSEFFQFCFCFFNFTSEIFEIILIYYY